MASELKPRLCVIAKGPCGYGFHLHGEKGKTGQYIRKVEPESPAEAAGLRAGDRVVEVNGENVEKETHYQVVQRIRAVEHETRLLVVDSATDEYLQRLRFTCTAECTVVGDSAAPTSPGSSENGPVTPQPAPPPAEEPKPITPAPSLSVEKLPQETVSLAQPRLVRLQKREQGYGFNLHSDKNQPGQYIRSVDPGSPAEQAGLMPKDRLVEVNGVNIEKLRHAEVVALIRSGGSEASLLVVDPATDKHFRKQGSAPTESHTKDFQAEPVTNGSHKVRPSSSSASQSSQSTSSELSSPDTSTQAPEEDKRCLLDPFEESGLFLSPTAAEAKQKVQAKRAHKRAPPMDWSKKYEIFSNF